MKGVGISHEGDIEVAWREGGRERCIACRFGLCLLLCVALYGMQSVIRTCPSPIFLMLEDHLTLGWMGVLGVCLSTPLSLEVEDKPAAFVTVEVSCGCTCSTSNTGNSQSRMVGGGDVFLTADRKM